MVSTESIIRDIRDAGGVAIGFEADVTDVDALDRLAAAAADAFGSLDVGQKCREPPLGLFALARFLALAPGS